ncbi:hypothetical protein V1477_018274, partial [Vespula maculifrons]
MQYDRSNSNSSNINDDDDDDDDDVNVDVDVDDGGGGSGSSNSSSSSRKSQINPFREEDVVFPCPRAGYIARNHEPVIILKLSPIVTAPGITYHDDIPVIFVSCTVSTQSNGD